MGCLHVRSCSVYVPMLGHSHCAAALPSAVILGVVNSERPSMHAHSIFGYTAHLLLKLLDVTLALSLGLLGIDVGDFVCSLRAILLYLIA